MNNAALCLHQSMFFHSGYIEENDRPVALCCVHILLQYSLDGVKQCLSYMKQKLANCDRDVIKLN